MGLDRRSVRRAGAAAAAAVLTLALVACGSDTPAGSPSTAPSDDAGTTPSETPSPTPSGLAGSWTPNPGQADKVQQTLTAAGFECTRSTDPGADIRLCSSAKPTAKAPHGVSATIDYLSDPQGTVLLANLYAASPDSAAAEAAEKTMAEAVLPAADAAVLLADGDKLSWGYAQKVDSNRFLSINGWDESNPMPYTPAFTALTTSKEKALPALQAGKLKCSFKDMDKWGKKEPSLTCQDPAFKSEKDDGSIEGPTAELVAVDLGTGVNEIRLEGRHAGIADDTRAVKSLLPRALTTDPALQEVGAWAQAHLDGRSHAAYVGQWRVSVRVTPKDMLGDSVTLTVAAPKPNVGFPTPR